MSMAEEIIEGTIKPDGTLELDHQPGLTPGRVVVTVRAKATSPSPRVGLAEVVEQIRQDQQARGFAGLTAQEMAVEEAARRQEDEDEETRWEALWSQTQTGPPR